MSSASGSSRAVSSKKEKDSSDPSELVVEVSRLSLLSQIMVLITFTFRGYFGQKKYERWGHWIERYMVGKIHEFCCWVNYPSGDHTLTEHGGELYSCVLSQSGRYLYTCSSDCSVIHWDLRLNRIAAKWQAHDDFVRCLDLYREMLVTGSDDCTLRIWDAFSHELRHSVDSEHTSAVLSVQWFDHDQSGLMLVSGSNDGTIILRSYLNVDSIISTTMICHFSEHTRPVSTIRVACDVNGNAMLISGSWDRSLRLWDLTNEISEMSEQSKKTVMDGVTDSVYSVDINCDLTRVACVCRRSVIIYGWPEMNIERRIAERATTARFHTLDPNMIAIGGDFGTIKLFDLKRGECVKQDSVHKGGVRELRFSPDATKMISVSRDCTVRVRDVTIHTSSLLGGLDEVVLEEEEDGEEA